MKYFKKDTLYTILFFLFCLPSISIAHQSSESYFLLKKHDNNYTATLYTLITDLNKALPLDENKSNSIENSEINKNIDAINQYILSKISINKRAKDCPIQFEPHKIEKLNFGVFLSTSIIINCNTALNINYQLFYDVIPHHKGIITYISKDSELTKVMTESSHSFDAKSHNWMQGTLESIIKGIWHILTGMDHILFLMALLIAYFKQKSDDLHGYNHIKTIILDIVIIATIFSIAHSVTLILSALSLISLPSKWVEVAIALTVVLAGINIIYPLWKKKEWLIVFLFGLIHGVGFSSALADLSLPFNTLMLNIITFNIGVELGQIIIIGLSIPLLYFIRNARFFQKMLIPVSAIFIVIIGMVWSMSRIFS